MPPDELEALANGVAAWAAKAAGCRLQDFNNNTTGDAHAHPALRDAVVGEVPHKAKKFSTRRAQHQQRQQHQPALAVPLQRRGSDVVDDEEYLYPVLTCCGCGDLFPTRHELLLHRLQLHPLHPHQCPDCLAAFAGAGLLEQHRLSHTADEPHACAHCPRRFSLKAHVKSHTRVLHPPPRGPEHRCGTCVNKVFQTAAALANHQKYHATDDERPFACDLCRSTFKRRANLTRHVKQSHPAL